MRKSEESDKSKKKAAPAKPKSDKRRRNQGSKSGQKHRSHVGGSSDGYASVRHLLHHGSRA
jgi:hypothetical protein